MTQDFKCDTYVLQLCTEPCKQWGGNNLQLLRDFNTFWMENNNHAIVRELWTKKSKNLVICTALTTYSRDEMKYFLYRIHYRKKCDVNDIASTHYIAKELTVHT